MATLDDFSYTNTVMPAMPNANAMMPVIPTPPSSSPTPEMVQQMIVNAFLALGLLGNTKKSATTLYMDLGASNHLTNSSKQLSKLKPCDGNL